jgi:hypothetical protein
MKAVALTKLVMVRMAAINDGCWLLSTWKWGHWARIAELRFILTGSRLAAGGQE